MNRDQPVNSKNKRKLPGHRADGVKNVVNEEGYKQFDILSNFTWEPVNMRIQRFNAIRDSISFIGQWRLLSDHNITDVFDETRPLPSPARPNIKANGLSGWARERFRHGKELDELSVEKNDDSPELPEFKKKDKDSSWIVIEAGLDGRGTTEYSRYTGSEKIEATTCYLTKRAEGAMKFGAAYTPEARKDWIEDSLAVYSEIVRQGIREQWSLVDGERRIASALWLGY
ncbi:hypothetical protein B0H19DRAFT_1079929 [Mycena capillaripes]|nr:hypothetical protein B0H19DRAFT_1079929 [Mycena capillaripes]